MRIEIMDSDIRKRLFSNYANTHIAFLKESEKEKLRWFKSYAELHYFPNFGQDSNSGQILEIGCNRGYLLKILNDHGYVNLTGIDLSPSDLEYAAKLNTGAKLKCEDAFAHLGDHHEFYSLIIIKAVLEHIPKTQVAELIAAMKKSLVPGGTLLIDVPNMDWLFATHERYMDFTHEVGFTKESLGQLLRLEFGNATLVPINNNINLPLVASAKKWFAQYVLDRLFSWADPEGASNPIWCRSILGIAKR